MLFVCTAARAPPYVSQRPSHWRGYQRTPITKRASRLIHTSCYSIMQWSCRSPPLFLAPSQSSPSTVMTAFSLLYIKIKTKKEEMFFLVWKADLVLLSHISSSLMTTSYLQRVTHVVWMHCVQLRMCTVIGLNQSMVRFPWLVHLLLYTLITL